MELYRFDTNLKCEGCIQQIKPHLDNEPAIEHWEVIAEGPKKILLVKAEGLSAEEIRSIIAKAGFTSELRAE